MRERLWALVKTAVFTVIVPASVVVWIPWSLGMLSHAAHPAPAVYAAGSIVAAIGIAVYLSSAFSFAWSGRGTPSPTDWTKQLVVVGPYRYSRNPMYVGVLLALIGEFTMFGTPIAAGAIYIAIFLAAVNLFIRWYEEPALLRRFGAEYAEYCRRVPRWIGRFGRSS